ncbi:cytochrome ubiquinol oxidase subunit I [Bacteroides sp.]|uniref:cytochrome ubiquinol oxidase subunit I n=1 Tax=Bacteroides sp. TaxID=29523 RepID=UPI001B45B84D|nr:cytochrome ubiquinol oxidase subunit I [Bacteroides sp.]MBP6065533.1 cytochrome ubiquinol oxidase subunit I [Bacteroides sp.]MBP6067640.1 cytochrome ubiquinol oxidase subunit I [Bacteroides sp.]MBP6936548.1 cytochrome ubiquinol oxidase subunit I [Bacteroides sp.]MBP8622552.1 cytochrome ubiquinol oxidase subunit I [Bacteroides sp.]MBP9507510.1 cytochrome ubiquinol oxidase subunit I [Bacteroides sp.]
MIESIDTSLIDWSRAQFAMTAMYHWLFVPLTLGLAVVIAVMETVYYKTGDLFWKKTTQFWMKLFGINFAIGVATGLILEFQFGTNWSNYSWFVGDIFGAPLAIEGILAFFMEATFIAVMFFGWNKVSKRFHLISTWLTGLGATISAWWILVANAWMQHPVGMEFNPDTVRNEMVDFWAVALSPVAVNKFFHTVLSGWVLGAVFVVGVSCWYLLKKRDTKFAIASIKIGALLGLVSSLLVAWTGDGSGYQVAQTQPMKLAAVEGYYEGKESAGLVAFGILNPAKEYYNDGKKPFLVRIEVPSLLSFLAERDVHAFVPGITNIIEGGYMQDDGTIALSAAEKMERGKTAIAALAAYREAKKANNVEDAQLAYSILQENIPYFGYGYIKDVNDLVPNIPLNFYAFRIMVYLGCYFILFFLLVSWLVFRKDLTQMRWMHWVGLCTIPLGYIAGQAGWVVAECGRQPWAIRDMLPTSVSISKLDVSSVQTTFFIFVVLFTVMLIAEIGIMLKEIKKGPEE